MQTHILSREHRRLALISLFASLCSVFAVQLAIHSADTSELSAAATDVSYAAQQKGGEGEYRVPASTHRSAGARILDRFRVRFHKAACPKEGCDRVNNRDNNRIK